MGLDLTFWRRKLSGWGLQLHLAWGRGMWLSSRFIWFVHRPKMAPLLLSKEQDELVTGLRNEGFKERSAYNAQTGDWGIIDV